MSKFKKMKDPIYGYVDIPDDIVKKIIDTEGFQRLRDVIQTSYSPLYASSLHNRFVHSIGVYHLSGYVVEAIKADVEEVLGDTTKEYLDIFRLACLLHDVGHAPFSHTGEEFYLKDGKRDELHKRIAQLTGDATILKEIREQSYKAAPHELMSVIVALNLYGAHIEDEYKSFFARCITGYKYADENNPKALIWNCMIEMLNSNVIDVDKMDYLIRDAYTAGFETIAIDYERFLTNVRVHRNQQASGYTICFSKAALSIVENIVYARDMEKKWIQNHPSVLYECNLLKNIFEKIIDVYFENNYIEERSLYTEGITLQNNDRIRLLSDSDIRYLMKQLKKASCVEEFMNRNQRRHPMWKTEAEYKAIFLDAENELIGLIEEVDSLMDAFRTLGIPFEINQQSIEIFRSELDLFECEKKSATEKNSVQYIDQSIEIYKKHIEFMKIFEDYSTIEGLKFDFVILKTDQFNSGFGNAELAELKLMLPEMKDLCRFGEISGALKATNAKKSYFYLYYNREGAKSSLVCMRDLVKALVQYGAGRCAENKAIRISDRMC